ncbi:FAD:protein FMN transferase [Methylocystis sp. MJC1]|uniref:FAD:protein FMN transferase n=1 Tax=Methylocystis sp. MJC1 TaxID=2654282 RepID=UPI0019D17CF4|nr:FAD:protein FMN transferase [Methylocystis sp. MJC1]KAF2989563.1 FAD:protein FMN transferase [Methylocystis sp. MJC1]MBU6528523.1 FAD:protein FMN transferase [Methylocystis sp. MJC1]UZX11419.1 FAD:protein FMN transferase [Methylocystis sp. MJC1]
MTGPIPELFAFHFEAMGSPCEARLYAHGRDSAAAAAGAAVREVRRIEAAFSRYRDDSIVHAINAAGEAGGDILVDDETADLLDAAFEAYRHSDGLFDITSGVLREIWNDERESIPSQATFAEVLARVGLDKIEWRRPKLRFRRRGMQIDFGGIGKEYAADRAAWECRAQGIVGGVVDLGGDLFVIGPHPDGAPWRIGIRDPEQPERAVATLFIERGGVATSGNYERFWRLEGKRYGHILDPRSGWPVEGLSSVTVAAPSCQAAGLTATIAMLNGVEGAVWLKGASLPFICVDPSGGLEGSALIASEAAPITRLTPNEAGS